MPAFDVLSVESTHLTDNKTVGFFIFNLAGSVILGATTNLTASRI